MNDTQSTAGVLDTILEFNQDRKPKLLKLKFQRMLHDPFTFFRARFTCLPGTGSN